jgi:hypothetical protein
MNKFDAHKTDLFLETYEKHFAPLKDAAIRFLEIGVQYGGSIKVWEDYFSKASFVGVDIDENCAKYATPRTKVIIGDQSNVEFLRTLGEFDIIVDDGGHTMVQQQNSFNTLFPAMNPGGIYVVEDLHTSFWPQFADSKISTTDYLKSLTDTLHKEARSQRLQGREFPDSPFDIASIHFYPSLAVIYKNK